MYKSNHIHTYTYFGLGLKNSDPTSFLPAKSHPSLCALFAAGAEDAPGGSPGVRDRPSGLMTQIRIAGLSGTA